QPVATVCTLPAPSRYLATKYGDSVKMRSAPSLPTVSSAVRVLPLRSFQRARRSPLRVMISAPVGRGLVTCFRKTVPTIHLPFLAPPALAGGNVQVQVVRQLVQRFRRQPSFPGHEPGKR